MKKEKFLQLAFGLMMVMVVIFNIGRTIWPQKEKYLSRNYWQRFPALEKTYLGSQYVNKNPTGWIPDETINAYAGGAYVRGVAPILVAPDTPPLGRYLIGLSALLFNNEHIIILVFGILSLFLLYLIGTQIFSSRIIAIIPPVLLSFEPIFKNQFAYTPLLDILQLVFLLLSFYFFNQGLRAKKRKRNFLFFLFSSLFLGLFISTKFFASGVTIIAAYFLVLLLHHDKKRLSFLILTLSLSVLVLLLSYVRVLTLGYNLRKFLGIQKWVFLYHKSQLILPFSIWPLILFNQWHVWFGDKPVTSDPQWQITWPAVTILSFVTILLYIFKQVKTKKEVEVLMAWIIFYFLFFSFGQISSRYLVILIPVLYLVAIFGIENITTTYLSQKRN